MTRVLQVITGLAAGGAERQLAGLLPHLPPGCEVACLTGGGVVGERIRAAGFAVHDLRMASNRDPAAVAALVRLIRHGGFALVHTHLYRAHLYGALAARLAGVRAVVATEHSLGSTLIEGRRKDRPGIRALYQAAERLRRVTVAVSPAVADRLREWRITRIEVIPNAIDVSEFGYDEAAGSRARQALGIGREAFVVGGVGRLTPDKHFEVLIEAASGIAGATVLLVGTGPEQARLRALAAARLPGRAVFAGEVGGGALEIRDLLSAMDVFASPSACEAFGMAALEAVACGLPVVYADAPALDGLPELAERVTKAPPGAVAFQNAIGRAARVAPADRAVPPAALSRYGMAQQAARIRALYESVLGARCC